MALACLTTFVLWGVLAYTFARLLAFGVVYGFVAAGFASLWTGFTNAVISERHCLGAMELLELNPCSR
jgi:MFS transporter, MCT family, solute carrier family 16 (monocarboxylic acid transporters), member 10